MASDFQRRKISGVFGAMDADDDGYLTESDFRALTAIDENGDGAISADEYRRLIEAWTGV